MCYTNRQIDNRIDKIAALDRQIADLEKQRDELKKQITDELTERDIDSLDTGKWSVAWKQITGYRLDSKRMKQEAEALYTVFLIPTTSKRFTFKLAAR